MWLFLSVVCTGGALFACLWAVARPAALYSVSPAVPEAHRQALWWLWPWVRALTPLCEPFLPWTVRARMSRQLQLAGLADSWSVAQFAALQVVAGLASVLFLMPLLGMGTKLGLITGLSWALLAGGLVAWWPRQVLRQRGRQRQLSMLRDMPFLLDMTTLCVEAGLNLQGALHQAAHHGPPGPLRDELNRALADIRAGKARLEALADMASRTQLAPMASLVAALAQADQLGVSLGPLLRAQSDQRRSERFLRAEEQALKAPVKMLFPLVVCIFPCTFLVIGFPVMHHLLDGLA